MARPSIAELEATSNAKTKWRSRFCRTERFGRRIRRRPQSGAAESPSRCAKIWAVNTAEECGERPSHPRRNSECRRALSVHRSLHDYRRWRLHQGGAPDLGRPNVHHHVTFTGYPSTSRRCGGNAAVKHGMHMYQGGYICYMHPSVWNPGRHDLLYVLAQTAVWLNKHEIYLAKGVWPGPSLSHTA